METIWHVTLNGEPALPGDEGFVHCSFTSQLEGTLGVHFAKARQITLLRLDSESLGARLVIEPSRGGDLFPHVYGEISADDVTTRFTLTRGKDGTFNLSHLPP
jgi:uncharacterized protein (DUF952 family)